MRESIGKIPGGFNPAIIHLVGAIVTWWARAEGMMVQDLRWLRSLPVNASVYKNDMFPTQTKRTIKQWGKCQRNLWAGHAKGLKALELVHNEALALLEERNAIVHSFWPYWHHDPERIVLHSVKPVKDNPDKLLIVKYEASVDELDDLNERVRNLYHRVLNVSGAALNRAKQKQPKGDAGGG